jgi:endonuclease YncB( thermonuclease family)
MQLIQRLLAVLLSTLARALRFWARDIARRKTLLGKAASAILGFLVIICACSLMLGVARGMGEMVGLLPTRTPTSVPTARPAATATPRAAPTRRPATTTAPPAQSTATSAPALAPPAGDSPALPAGLPSAVVARVVDGDTVDVTLDGQTIRVRLIGIDTPEIVDPRKPVECFGREASARAHELLDGQVVFLEDDPSQGDVDRYGRALRYVWLADGRLINLEMVAQGYAFACTYDQPYTYQAQFKQAERDAREQQRGLWAPGACNGEHRPADEAPAAPATAEPPTIAPAQPTATIAPSSGLTITRPPGTVRRGARATVAAHTTPGAQCSIVVRYKSGPSKAQGLGPKKADAKGDVAWTWMVGTRTTPGSWPVTITCGGEVAGTEVVVP